MNKLICPRCKKEFIPATKRNKDIVTRFCNLIVLYAENSLKQDVIHQWFLLVAILIARKKLELAGIIICLLCSKLQSKTHKIILRCGEFVIKEPLAIKGSN